MLSTDMGCGGRFARVFSVTSTSPEVVLTQVNPYSRARGTTRHEKGVLLYSRAGVGWLVIAD